MADKNVIDFVFSDFITGKLHLCTLSAINQKYLIFMRQRLRSRMPVKGRNRRIGA